MHHCGGVQQLPLLSQPPPAVPKDTTRPAPRHPPLLCPWQRVALPAPASPRDLPAAARAQQAAPGAREDQPGVQPEGRGANAARLQRKDRGARNLGSHNHAGPGPPGLDLSCWPRRQQLMAPCSSGPVSSRLSNMYRRSPASPGNEGSTMMSNSLGVNKGDPLQPPCELGSSFF